jgi:pimeloyl-ACP methyl ester carboxylesterase
MEMPFKQSRIETNNVTLNVMQAGPEDGELVILLHGFPEFWYGWRNQIQHLADLGFRVWIPDQRGYNLSDKPCGVESYRMDALVADIIGLIDAADCQKARVVAHDWGGMVGWWLALRHPERLEKLVILNAPHPHVYMKTIRSSFRQIIKSWYIGAFQLPYLPERSFGRNNWEGAINAIVNSALPDAFAAEDLDQYRLAWSQPNAITNMMNWYRAYARHRPQKPETWRVSVPLLIIWGAQDKYLNEGLAQPSIEMCDDGELVIIENATHWVQHEKPDRVNQLLEDFLLK